MKKFFNCIKHILINMLKALIITTLVAWSCDNLLDTMFFDTFFELYVTILITIPLTIKYILSKGE